MHHVKNITNILMSRVGVVSYFNNCNKKLTSLKRYLRISHN